MKILLSWLNDYGDFGDPTNADDVQRVADALTSLGLEVDSVTTVGELYDEDTWSDDRTLPAAPRASG